MQLSGNSLAAYQAAAPLEMYPGEPSDGECVHGIPEDIVCWECIAEHLMDDIREL